MPGGRITGFFPSLKCKASVPYHSLLERDYLYLLEWDACLLSYQRLPDEGPAPVADLFSQFLLRFPTRCRLVILAPTILTEAQLLPKKRWAQTQGYDLAVRCAEELRQGHQLTNVKLLWRSARLPVPHPFIWRSPGDGGSQSPLSGTEER